MKNIVYIWVALAGMIACTSGTKEKVSDDHKMTIAVTNYPLYFLTTEIAGSLVSVYLPDLGGDPAYWKPDAAIITEYQQADLVIANGAGFEKWMEKASMPSSRLLNSSESFSEQWIETDDAMVHSHGPEGLHSHKGTAFTTWLNFDFAARQAEAVYSALVQKFPDRQEMLENNLRKLKGSMNVLSSRMRAVADGLDGQTIIASHPVYQYLSEGYGLDITSLHWEPGEMPDDDEWALLIKLSSDTGAKIMIWEGEPGEEIRNKLSALEIKTVVFDPCGNRPKAGDFLTVMEENVTALEMAVGIL